MTLSRRQALAAAATLTGLASTPLRAQGFPTGPVRITSAYPAGSGPDALVRVIADKLGAAWQQPVIIDPKPGGNGILAATAVKAAARSGHELMLADVGHLAINPSLYKRLPYDPEQDFVPVVALYRTAFFIVVGAQGPHKTIGDLIAAAAKGKDKVSYGSAGVGSPMHLGGAQLEAATHTAMLHVAYKEASPLYAALSNGELDWAFGTMATVGPLVKAGKLTVLAVADSERSPLLPQVPTLAEAGGPAGVQVMAWVALVAPRGASQAQVLQINQAVNAALRLPDVQERLKAFGFTPLGGDPAQLADRIRTDTVKYAAWVKRAGASLD